MVDRMKVIAGLVLLFSSMLPVSAEELVDPTLPPAIVLAPAAAVVPEVKKVASLQSVIIAKNRRAAIIDGQTVELGGRFGSATLIEVSEVYVVLKTGRHLQKLTLFPGVGIKRIKPDAP